jgi:hypothetical protein
VKSGLLGCVVAVKVGFGAVGLVRVRQVAVWQLGFGEFWCSDVRRGEVWHVAVWCGLAVKAGFGKVQRGGMRFALARSGSLGDVRSGKLR